MQKNLHVDYELHSSSLPMNMHSVMKTTQMRDLQNQENIQMKMGNTVNQQDVKVNITIV